MIIDNLIICSITFILLFIAYKDYKQRIIPDIAVVFVFILTGIYFFTKDGVLTDFVFYIFFASVPILIISFIVDSFSSPKANAIDYIIILISIIIGFIVPFDFKIKYIIACSVFILLILFVPLFIKKDNAEQDEEGFSIGGGDIKLIAALGPIFGEHIIIFLFFSFLLAYLFMKCRKESNIYLAPFMFVSFLVYFTIKIGGSII